LPAWEAWTVERFFLTKLALLLLKEEEYAINFNTHTFFDLLVIGVLFRHAKEPAYQKSVIRPSNIFPVQTHTIRIPLLGGPTAFCVIGMCCGGIS